MCITLLEILKVKKSSLHSVLQWQRSYKSTAGLICASRCKDSYCPPVSVKEDE